MQWDDLKIILAICRAGTLSGAAENLGLHHSTVFRRLNLIEKELGVRFFERLTTGYVMTDAGESAMRVAERLDNEVIGLTRELIGKDLRLQGTIRISAPEGITFALLIPFLNKFSKIHPGIHFDLVVSNSPVQLSRREADIAVRATTNPPDTSLGRRVCRFRYCMYASESYMKKNANKNLEDYEWLMIDSGFNWLPESIWSKGKRRKAKIKMSSNNTMSIVEAAKTGMGVAPLPCFLGDSEKKLVRVIEPPEDLALDLWVLTHPDLRHTARVRALMTHLYESFLNEVRLFEGDSV